MEPSLLSWLRTFAGDDASDLVDFADGAILLGVAQDTMEGFDELGVSQDLGGLLQSLEHAYAVSGAGFYLSCALEWSSYSYLITTTLMPVIGW